MAKATSLIGLGRYNAYDSIVATTTDSILVAAVPGFKIRVLSYMVNQGDTTPSTVAFNSKGGSAGTAIWPTLKYAANGGSNSPEIDSGWFETNVGEGLSVSTGTGSTTGVAVVFTLVRG